VKDKTKTKEAGTPSERHATGELGPKSGIGTVKDETKMNEMSVPRARRSEDGLGPNSDIGAKLRAFYGAVQDQPIPDKFLDLLEKLDEVEQASKRKG
jgi:hypothetical protein